MKKICLLICLIFTFTLFSQETIENPYAFRKGTINNLTNHIEVSKKELDSVVVGVKGITEKVRNFKVKIKGLKTEFVKGNTFSRSVKSKLRQSKKGTIIMVYDIRFDQGTKTNGLVDPVSFEIK